MHSSYFGIICTISIETVRKLLENVRKSPRQSCVSCIDRNYGNVKLIVKNLASNALVQHLKFTYKGRYSVVCIERERGQN